MSEEVSRLIHRTYTLNVEPVITAAAVSVGHVGTLEHFVGPCQLTPTERGFQRSSIPEAMKDLQHKIREEAGSRVKEMLKSLFCELGITNIEPAAPNTGDCLKAYWDSYVTRIEQLRGEGTDRHAKTLFEDLLGYYEHGNSVNEVKPMRSGYQVTVDAWRDSHFDTYTETSERKLTAIILALEYVVREFEILGDYQSIEAITELRQFKSGKKVEIHPHLSMTFYCATIKLRLSASLMESVQVFLARQGFELAA